MAAEQPHDGPRIHRELAVFLALVVLVPALGLLYTVAFTNSSGRQSESAALVAATATVPATATAGAATTTPTPEPQPTPYIPQQSEFGVAAVADASATADAVTARNAGPTEVDTSSFPAPPPRGGSAPRNSSGISRVVSSGLGIDHYVEVVGVVNNVMQTPSDGTYAIGWYRDYDRPGSGGNVIVSAHETWNHQRGPFYGLHRARNGDEIDIKMADGTVYRYVVFSNVRYSLDNIPMGQIIWPSARPAGEEWLTLMTCGGRIVYNSRGFGEYLDRDVVIARRVG